jgi:uncharacterized protein with PIN domain
MNQDEMEECSYCGGKFLTLRDVNIHVAKHHGNEAAESYRYYCDHCGESFWGPGGLILHKENVHTERVDNLPKTLWTLIFGIAIILIILNSLIML